MENQSERVLAYTLAKQISHEELSDVSGGVTAWHMTQYMSGGPSGGSGSWDVHIDIKLDL